MAWATRKLKLGNSLFVLQIGSEWIPIHQFACKHCHLNKNDHQTVLKY